METKVRYMAKLLFAAASALGTQSATAIDDPDGSRRLISTRAIFEKNIELTATVTRVFDAVKRFPEITGGASISADIDVEKDVVVIDLGTEYMQVAGSPDMDDFQREITAVLFDALGNPPKWQGVELRFGGVGLSVLFPEVRASRRVSPKSTMAPDPNAESPRFLIAAGHGFYFNHKYGDWRPQRDVSNGILEDDITQDFAGVAKAWVEREVRGRSRNVILARSLSAASHAESGEPWRRMSARYWVKEQFPELESQWAGRGDSANGDRERIQDLYSRPILANHLGALAAVHLHTNASSNPDRSGLQVYYQKGNPKAETFGKNVLCQLWRSIGDGYPRYKVPLIPLPGDYAELRGSKMPAVIIELGFHTNVEDARILQKPGFMDSVANAIDRSFTYQLDDTTCGPLLVNDFKYQLFSPGDEDWPGAKLSFSYEMQSGEDRPAQLNVHIRQDGQCKETLVEARVDNIWYKNVRPTPGAINVGLTCNSPFTDEPVEVSLLSYDQLLWSKKMKLTCSHVYPVEFCGCTFCPSDLQE